MAKPTPPPFETLRVQAEGDLGRLTLNQPERLNPLGSLALEELASAANWFDEIGSSVVVVAGAGRAFCAGFDLRELSAPSEQSLGSPELGAAMSASVSSMRAVTIASIQGPCVGGGFVLAMCCDLRIATEDAWFSLPESELGIPLAWSGVPLLVREIGPARTTELVLTCRRLPAAEASRWGLLNQVVAPEQLAAATDEMAATVLERLPFVIAATKEQVRDAAEALVPTNGVWAGTEYLVAALRSLGQ